jgi:hypothetical protein
LGWGFGEGRGGRGGVGVGEGGVGVGGVGVGGVGVGGVGVGSGFTGENSFCFHLCSTFWVTKSLIYISRTFTFV